MPTPLTASLENYLGVILRLQKDKLFARVRDIADLLKVAQPAVTSALKTLSRKGFVHYKPYEPTTLTPLGKEYAERILFRRQILEEFLKNILRLKTPRVESMACAMEHALDPKGLERFVCFLAFIHRQKKVKGNLISEFQAFLCKGKQDASCKEYIMGYIDQIKQESVHSRG